MNPITITTLAISDNWTIGMFVVSLAYNGALTLGLFYLRGSNEKVATNLAKIDGLEAEVKTYATELINSKLGHISESIDEINKRLAAGDGKFDNQNERDHQIELQFVTAIENLRRELAERFATRDELNQLQAQQQKLELKLAQQAGSAS